MSNERYIMQGHLGELEDELSKLEDLAEGILESLRLSTFVNPLASALDLDADKLANYTEEYRELHTRGKAVRSGIEKLKDELGIR